MKNRTLSRYKSREIKINQGNPESRRSHSMASQQPAFHHTAGVHIQLNRMAEQVVMNDRRKEYKELKLVYGSDCGPTASKFPMGIP